MCYPVDLQTLQPALPPGPQLPPPLINTSMVHYLLGISGCLGIIFIVAIAVVPETFHHNNVFQNTVIHIATVQGFPWAIAAGQPADYSLSPVNYFIILFP